MDVISKAERDALNLAAATCLITDGRAFSMLEGSAWLAFFHKLRPGWKPVTRKQVTERLPEVYKLFLKEVLKLFRASDHLSVIFDASDNVSHHRIVNISVKLPDDGPALYWKTFDTGDKQHTAENWVELIMPELEAITEGNLKRINSICTDTEATMRATHDLLQKQPVLKHVIFSLCDSHGQQLLIKDILSLPYFEKLMEDVANVMTFFSRSKLQFSRLRACQRNRWLGHTRALIRRYVFSLFLKAV